jgi:hypothetical protein
VLGVLILLFKYAIAQGPTIFPQEGGVHHHLSEGLSPRLAASLQVSSSENPFPKALAAATAVKKPKLEPTALEKESAHSLSCSAGVDG